MKNLITSIVVLLIFSNGMFGVKVEIPEKELGEIHECLYACVDQLRGTDMNDVGSTMSKLMKDEKEYVDLAGQVRLCNVGHEMFKPLKDEAQKSISLLTSKARDGAANEKEAAELFDKCEKMSLNLQAMIERVQLEIIKNEFAY